MRILSRQDADPSYDNRGRLQWVWPGRSPADQVRIAVFDKQRDLVVLSRQSTNITFMNIKLFAGAAASVGRDAIDVQIQPPVSVAELRLRVAQTHPQLEPLLKISRFAVGREMAEESQIVGEHDEVAIIPPVSGG